MEIRMKKLLVNVQPYDYRDESMYEVEGDTLMDCMFEVINKSSYSLEEEEKGDFKTLQDYFNYIDSFNGDGCDYIVSIIDLDKGEVIYK